MGTIETPNTKNGWKANVVQRHYNLELAQEGDIASAAEIALVDGLKSKS